MGVTCKVTLSNQASWKKVGKVACVLLGADVRKEPLGSDGYHAVVTVFDNRMSQEKVVASKLLGKEPDAQFSTTHTPEYIDILVEGNSENLLVRDIDNSDSIPYRLWYGLESKSLYPKATAAKIALAEGIVKFFGGRITYNDHTDKKRTFPGIVQGIDKEDDRSFYRFQDALLALKPLTQKDITRNQKHAAY